MEPEAPGDQDEDGGEDAGAPRDAGHHPGQLQDLRQEEGQVQARPRAGGRRGAGLQRGPAAVQELGAGLGRGEEPLAVLDEAGDDLVAELDVHDGGHGLLPRPQQTGPEHHAQVGGRHQVLITF